MRSNPGTSNLDPRPGSPPTPNAVNTPLSDIGTFNIYNDADHDHDDRYFTEGEADARFVLATAAEGGDVTPANVYGFDYKDASGWNVDEVLDHNDTSPASECTNTPLDLPAGRTVDALTMSYITTSGADVRVFLLRATNFVGPITDDDEIIAEPIRGTLTVLAATTEETIASVTFEAAAPELIDPGASYVAGICTAHDLTVVGFTARTPLP